MVRHTHQDFLWTNNDSNRILLKISEISSNGLDNIQSYDEPQNLFDFTSAGYIRKISISKIDRDIDDEKDWKKLISQVKYVDKLLIIDDRIIVDNPIVKKYDESTKINFMKAFSRDGIKCSIVKVSNH